VRPALGSRAPWLCALLLAGVALPVGAGTISGRLFTAEHPDSIAPNVSVTLVFRGPGDELQHLSVLSDETGHFHFIDVDADTSIGYVLRLDYKGREFLGTPIRFQPGQAEITFNVLLSDQAPPEGALPEGHPPVQGSEPIVEPAVQKPVHMILIAAWISLLFVGVALLARRGREAGSGVPAPARTLARDIASLDLRHTEGAIGLEEYEKVRAGLVERLRVVSKGRSPR
jgi:hypothetical protein